MNESTFISDVLSNVGLMINEELNSETLVSFPIKFDKKNMKYSLDSNYKTRLQPLGTFLADFLNCDFGNLEDFKLFFDKYPLSLLSVNKIKQLFKNGPCLEYEYNKFIEKIIITNKSMLLNFQNQTIAIIDYCLLNPPKIALKFSPEERFYTLSMTQPSLSILTINKCEHYRTHLTSSYSGDNEKEIYEFLSKKKNKLKEVLLIIPHDFSSMIYNILFSVIKEKVYLKSCKNCKKYFIAKNKSSEYCINIAPNEKKKTCKDIGRINVFKAKNESDPALSLYYKNYNNKSMMKSRNKDIKIYETEFSRYSKQGKKKLEKYKNGIISSDEFINWIKNFK